MKKGVICTILLWGAFIANGQIAFEAQIGGSNFLGISLNTTFDIQLSESGNHYIVPSLGLGILVPGWNEPTSIIHTGLNYRYKKWGLGAEVSGFMRNPFGGDEYNISSFVDMIIYPNANYTFQTKTNWYFKISVGAYFAFSKQFYYESSKNPMYFAGDVIPGAGFSTGYKF